MEKLFWSIALPGFGQLLNGKYVKGILFIALEILVNVKANLNIIIILSFHGKTQEAVEQTNYGWLMFYPCLYLFAIWDAYKDSEEVEKPYSFMPFVFAAYFGTVGVIFSPDLKILGILCGSLWLPIAFLILGLFIGALLKSLLIRISYQ